MKAFPRHQEEDRGSHPQFDGRRDGSKRYSQSALLLFHLVVLGGRANTPFSVVEDPGGEKDKEGERYTTRQTYSSSLHALGSVLVPDLTQFRRSFESSIPPSPCVDPTPSGVLLLSFLLFRKPMRRQVHPVSSAIGQVLVRLDSAVGKHRVDGRVGRHRDTQPRTGQGLLRRRRLAISLSYHLDQLGTLAGCLFRWRRHRPRQSL